MESLEIFPLRINKTYKGIEIYTIASWMEISDKNVIKLYNWLKNNIIIDTVENPEIVKLEQEKEQLKFEAKLQKEHSVINYEKLYGELTERYFNLESKYNELKSQYDMGLIFSIKGNEVMTKKYDNLNEKESIYRHILHKVASNNGFLVQTFKDYSNLQYCYDNFIKHGFDVQQVGSDTLIIRNKK